MSDYGLLQEVRIVQRGSTLTTAAGIGDTELVVDYAGDFDYDPDDPDNTGGTLDLNGARLTYTSVTFGELPDDPDTLILAVPLTAAADADDFVGAVSGGQIGEDWEAHVTMGEGDQVVALLTIDQRAQWPVGVYDDPVPVVISDDLRRIEDAPGRTAPAAVQFRNTDTATVTDPVGDQPILLTYEPLPGSEHVCWHPNGGGGLHVPAAAWSRSGRLITVAEFDGVAVDDLLTCEYALYPGQRGARGVTIADPVDGDTVADTTPTITGTGEPGYSVDVEVDGATVGTLVVDTDGAWSVTVGSALTPGGHSITATQTGGGSTTVATANFTTPAPVAPTPSLVGTTVLGVWDSVADTQTFTLPPGTAVGDLIIVAARGDVAPGGGETLFDVTCSDPRMTLAFKATALNGSDTIVESVFIGIEDGSGDPIVLDNVVNPSYNTTVRAMLATLSGANGWGAVSAVETGLTTPVVGGVAAVAVTWIRGASFTTVNADPPSGYTDIGDTATTYSCTCISWWYDSGGSFSPAGTFTGEGCCVIAIV